MAKGRRNRIAGQFAARPIPMLESPPYRALSRGAHQVLSRIEIEHAHHGGTDNGVLPIAYDHFAEYGLHRHAIAPAIRELVALGFIEVMRRGCALNGDLRQASLYRLTYRHAKDAEGDGTHEWRKIATIEQAEALAKDARLNLDPRVRSLAMARAQKQNASAGFRQISVPKTVTVSAKNQWRKPSLQRVSETGTTSISRGESCPDMEDVTQPRDGRLTLTGLPMPPNVDVLTPDDGLPSRSQGDSSDGPSLKLAWIKPAVCELTGAEKAVRLAEIRIADQQAEIAAALVKYQNGIAANAVHVT